MGLRCSEYAKPATRTTKGVPVSRHPLKMEKDSHQRSERIRCFLKVRYVLQNKLSFPDEISMSGQQLTTITEAVLELDEFQECGEDFIDELRCVRVCVCACARTSSAGDGEPSERGGGGGQFVLDVLE